MNVLPFIFICSSSGTGKTQLPFSLEIPVLYFTRSKSTNTTAQSIHQIFSYQSLQLQDCVHSDMKEFALAISNPNYDLESLEQAPGFRYRTCGFLVGLLKKILEQAGRNDQQLLATTQTQHVALPQNWLLAEAQCPAFDYQDLTIEQAMQQLREIFGQKNPVVLIFLDEIVGMLDPDLRFLRSIVSSLRLELVMMGNHVQVEDFVKLNHYDGSRVCERAWCYFVFKLPPVCTALIEEKRRNVMELFHRYQSRSTAKTKIEEFVELLFKLMANERPLFFMKACSVLESVLEGMNVKSIMPEFDKGPITGLCFTGAYPVLDQFFQCRDETRASCLEKYYDLFSPLHDQYKSQELNGMYLEKVAAMSLILASHAVSIGDVLTFDLFFKQFIRELQDDYIHEPVVKCELMIQGNDESRG